MRKLLLTLFAALTATFAMGQKVTLDFTSNSWGLPEGSAKKTVTAADFTSGDYTIRLEGSTGNGYYWNTDKYLILGKANATLTLPAFNFAVGKIVITGRNGASSAVGTNIFVGNDAVSTELAGCTGVNTYEIADAYQAAGNVYTLKVLTNHNMQIVKIEIYEVGDEGGGDTPTPTLQDISNEPESAYTVSQAINFINNKETYDLSKEVYVKGEVGEVTEVSTEHGNATYTLMDVTGATLTVYRGKYLKNKSFFNEDLIQDGDEAVVFGKLILYQKEGEDDQYQMAQGNYLYSLNGETEPEEEPAVEAQVVTVAQFNAAAVSTTTWYQLTGTVKNLKSGDQYGNFDLEDETGSVYVYGLLSEKDGEKKQFQALAQEKGIVNGCTLTLIGNRGVYGEKIEVLNAFFVSVVQPEMPTETITVSEAHATSAGTIVSLQGTVYALCSTGAVLGDKTGFIYYYNKNIADMKWNIGDQGTITGALSAYGGFNQFTDDAEVEYIGHTDVTYPTPTELDVDAWVAQPAIQYVTLTGTLEVNNNRYNLVVDGKKAQGSIVGAMSDMFAGIASGATITVEGFAMYTTTSTSTNTTYVNIIATKVTVDGEGGEGEGGGDTPDPVVDGDNLLTNGSFEEWVSDEEPTDWKSTNSASSNATTAKSDESHSGKYAVEVKGITSGNKRMATKEIALEAGTYTFSIWMKSAGEASVAKLGYAYVDGESLKYVYFKGTDNKEIEYNITPEYTQYSGSFTLDAATTVNIVVMNNKKSNAVSIIADDASLTKSEGGDNPIQKEDISNEPTAPYTVSHAINFINDNDTYDLSKEVYVVGEVGEVIEVSTEHGNATYTITDGKNTLTIYRGKYLRNKAFTNEEQIQDGDEVVVYGRLMLYQKEGQDDQYQMAQGNYLYSKNGETEPEEEDITLVTVSEAQAAAAGTVVALQGTVYALCTTGAVLGDETGFIYYYNKNIADMKWNIGDQGTISGAVSAFGGFNQFTNTAEVKYIGHTDVTYPTPVELDVDAWVAAPVIQYVTLKGELSISGNYYNIIVDGKTAQGSIVGAVSDMFAGIESGAKVIVEGFVMYTTTSKSGATYANIIATKATADGNAIDGVKANNEAKAIYDLSGRRVEKAVKGIYIVNGKKVIF